jgi:hypothetical protein
MRTGHQTGEESSKDRKVSLRRLRRGHGATLLLTSASLVVGSILAVTGPTAAVAAKAASVHISTLGRAGSSSVKAGVLARGARTTVSMAPVGSAPPNAAKTYQAAPNVGVVRAANRRTAAVVSFPSVTCAPIGPGCDTVNPTSGGAKTNRYALAATANGGLYGEDIEPPDQGLCAGNGYVMESINIGEIQVYNANLKPVTGDTSLDSLMGLTGLDYSSGGDIMCEYDAANGGHWFITEIVSTTLSPFSGCFAGVFDTCREGLAVSTTDNPLATSWNVYFLDPNDFSPSDPGAGFLLNDYGKMGMTRDALLFFYDEFNLSGSLPACPAASCDEFNGAQEFAIQKNALELGYLSANLVHENMGTDPYIQPPDGDCFTGPTAGASCWYQVIPATSPTGQFDNAYGGTGFMAATLDFNAFAIGNGTGDNRAAVFYWTGLSALNSAGCSACALISFGGQLFTGLESYTDSGQGCPAATGNPCGMAPQRFGTLDLGTYCEAFGLAAAQPCPEQGIATNGDGVTQASYVGGQLSFAISTLINQSFGTTSEIHVGAAYWMVGTSLFKGGTHLLTLTSQGYVAAAHEDLEFPTLVNGAGSKGSLMSFTLSGDGGPTAADGGGFFPSSAYGLVTTTSAGLVGSTVWVSALGKAPQDGFSEYEGLPGPVRPRWGDYGAAVFVPGTGIYFASEYIQYPNCNPAYFFGVDDSCGGKRDPYANFGTSINLLK